MRIMNHPRIEIDDLTAVIRESIAAQKHDVSNGSTPRETPAIPRFPQLKLQPDFQPRSNNRYHMSDLLRYHDRVFVDSAYRAILKQPPDATEFAAISSGCKAACSTRSTSCGVALFGRG